MNKFIEGESKNQLIKELSDIQQKISEDSNYGSTVIPGVLDENVKNALEEKGYGVKDESYYDEEGWGGWEYKYRICWS